MERKLSGEKLQRTFINRFNSQLKGALKECVWREKVQNWPVKLYIDFTGNLFALSISTLYVGFSHTHVSLAYFFLLDLPLGFLIRNALLSPHQLQLLNRKIDNPFEYFMPSVEVDKVVRSAAFLSLKGKTLVREVKPETK